MYLHNIEKQDIASVTKKFFFYRVVLNNTVEWITFKVLDASLKTRRSYNVHANFLMKLPDP